MYLPRENIRFIRVLYYFQHGTIGFLIYKNVNSLTLKKNIIPTNAILTHYVLETIYIINYT